MILRVLPPPANVGQRSRCDGPARYASTLPFGVARPQRARLQAPFVLPTIRRVTMQERPLAHPRVIRRGPDSLAPPELQRFQPTFRFVVHAARPRSHGWDAKSASRQSEQSHQTVSMFDVQSRQARAILYRNDPLILQPRATLAAQVALCTSRASCSGSCL